MGCGRCRILRAGRTRGAGLICFDTPVVIWGVQGVADGSRSFMVERTKRYIESLAGSRTRVMIPSVVAAEYLTGFSSEAERAAQIVKLERFFFVPPLDAPAATLAATLADNVTTSVPRPPGWRQSLKADCYIVATAIVHGAATVVTSADECRIFTRIASGRIKVIEVPSVPKQGNLLSDDDSTP